MPAADQGVHIYSKPEAQAVAEIVEKATAPHIITADRGDAQKAPVFVDRQGGLHSLKQYVDEYLPNPERRKGTARLSDLQSFIDLVRRFKDESSALFADPSVTAPKLSCVFDYSPEGPDIKKARFHQHRAEYAFPLSKEWQAWKASDAKAMSVAAFAEFLEDRLVDVMLPENPGPGAREFADKLNVKFASPHRLLELSRGLAIHVGHAVKQARNLQSGEAQVQFVETHTDEKGAPLEIPGAFLVNVPVFFGGHNYEIAARLRYRVNGGDILWFYQLHRVDRIFDDAFDDALEHARDETLLPLYLGSPEV